MHNRDGPPVEPSHCFMCISYFDSMFDSQDPNSAASHQDELLLPWVSAARLGIDQEARWWSIVLAGDDEEGGNVINLLSVESEAESNSSFPIATDVAGESDFETDVQFVRNEALVLHLRASPEQIDAPQIIIKPANLVPCLYLVLRLLLNFCPEYDLRQGLMERSEPLKVTGIHFSSNSIGLRVKWWTADLHWIKLHHEAECLTVGINQWKLRICIILRHWTIPIFDIDGSEDFLENCFGLFHECLAYFHGLILQGELHLRQVPAFDSIENISNTWQRKFVPIFEIESPGSPILSLEEGDAIIWKFQAVRFVL